MIAPRAGARILLATKPVDLRKGAHSLAVLPAEVLGADPFAGTVLVFRSRRADRIKMLLWDGSGLVLIWKQLDTSDNPAHGHCVADDEVWHLLMPAVGWDRVDNHRRRAGRRWQAPWRYAGTARPLSQTRRRML